MEPMHAAIIGTFCVSRQIAQFIFEAGVWVLAVRSCAQTKKGAASITLAALDHQLISV
jgi:hypothetical protein